VYSSGVVTQVPRGGSTSVEQRLVEQVSRGQWLDLIPEVPKGQTIDEDTMRSWDDDSQSCSAAVIRDILRGQLGPKLDPHGLRLRGARITGQLDLQNLTTDVNLELEDCLLEKGIFAWDAHLAIVGLARCQLEHPAEPPLNAVRLTCSVLRLTKARITAHVNAGAVRLVGARISGEFNCTGASLCNNVGPALFADSLYVGQNMLLRYEFSATGSGKGGAVRLLGANIAGQVSCAEASLCNKSGPALNADGLKVGQDMNLRRGFTATGSGDNGAVRLPAAHIGIRLDCSEASLCNDSGPALLADGLQVGQSMLLNDSTATGTGKLGAVRLTGAHIGGSLECDGAKLRNNCGPALYANRVQVGQVVNLRNGFACGGDPDDLGAVDLTGAQIGGSLHCEGAALTNESGSALVADSLQTGSSVYLRDGFTATSGGDDGVAVNLVRAQVGGSLLFDPARLGPDPQGRLAVDGLTYAGVPDTGRDWDWLCLLQRGTRSYAAQPYQHLAAGYRALGDERQVRETLIAQRDDELARTHPGGWERLWGKITKVTLGYGYKPWRALWGLAVVLVISCVLAVVLGFNGALTTTDKTRHQGQPCTVIQQVSVGLDLNLPVGTSLARAKCDLTKDAASATAFWLTFASGVLRVLAWVFAALFIAGFTSAVRKT
jgi:hypothetical protein